MANGRPHAFPTLDFFDEAPIGIEPGMDLRDYFAGQALPEVVKEFFSRSSDWENYNDVADSAYKIAEAMMQRRKDSNGQRED